MAKKTTASDKKKLSYEGRQRRKQQIIFGVLAFIIIFSMIITTILF